MTEVERAGLVSAGRALMNPEEDRLGYSSFAKQLADGLLKIDSPAAYVVAIYGPGGTGKTSLLNFVLDYLREEADRPVIMEFNPWWFSGCQSLLIPFFTQLRAVLSAEPAVAANNLEEQLTALVEILAGSGSIPAVKRGRNDSSLLFHDAAGLKRSLDGLFRGLGKKIVIVMDDIDRLQGERLAHLFQIVNGVGSFPGVRYLLSMDREAVLRNLREMPYGDAEVYLEEVVQFPVTLQEPDKTALRRILNERLEAVLGDTPDDLFHPGYWRCVYLNGIDHFIGRPRDVVRLSNTVSLTYPPVKGMVNFVDFVALESLRVFFPTVYDLIRKNPSEFAGHPGAVECGGLRGKHRNAFHDSWLRQIPEESHEAIKGLLMSVFPKLRLVWSGVYYASAWENEISRRLADCSPDSIRAYFRFSVAEGSISNVEMRAMLTLASDGNAFGAKLMELAQQPRPDGATRLRSFLERFLDYARVEEIAPDAVPAILDAFFRVGDDLLRHTSHLGRTHATDMIIVRSIILNLLRGRPETDNFQTLRKAIQKGNAVGTIVDVIANIDWQHGRYSSDVSAIGKDTPGMPDAPDRLISPKHVNEIQRAALEKVRKAAQDGALEEAPDLDSLLIHWKEWGAEQEVDLWVSEGKKDGRVG